MTDEQVAQIVAAINDGRKKGEGDLGINKWILGIISTLLLLFGGWMATGLNKQADAMQDMTITMAVLEATVKANSDDRFRREDGLELEGRMNGKVTALELRVQALEAR